MTTARTRALLGTAALVAALCPVAVTGSAPAAAAPPPACALSPSSDAAGPIDEDYYLPSRATLDVALLFVDYPESRAAASEIAAKERAVTEGTRERVQALTSGNVDLRFSTPVRDWIHLPGSIRSYGFGDADDYTQEDADRHVRAVLAAADDQVDFSAYDVVYFASSDSTPVAEASTATNRPEEESPEVDGVPIRAWVHIAPGVDDPADLIADHEALHLFGLPDLYAPGDDLDAFTGGFDVMGGAATQPELLAFQRWRLDHVADDRMVCLTAGEERELTLAPLTSSSGTLGFTVRTGQHTLLAGEYRTKAGLDAAGACKTGLLLYRVDDRIESGEGPIRVVDSSPGTAVGAGCGHRLDDAPFDLQQPSHTDPSGVQVTVLGMDEAGLRVGISASDAAPAPGVTVSPSVLSAGQVVTASWSGEPGQVVEVMSRTQPATAFSVLRTITLGPDGRATTTHKPQRNTRLTGRTAGTTTTGAAPLLSVRSVASMNVLGDGDGRQVVTGRVYPARPGRVVSVYRNGALYAQGRGDATGVYRIATRLPAGLVTVQVRTGDDTYNLGSRSAVEEYEIG